MFEAGAVADPQPPEDAPKYFENPEGCAIWTRGSISSVVVEGPKNQQGVVQYWKITLIYDTIRKQFKKEGE